MDTIVPDSINRYDSEQLPHLSARSIDMREARDLVAQAHAACEYNNDVLAPLMLVPAQDREVRARLG